MRREALPIGGDRVWGMGPRLILSNAQKSAGAHSPGSAGEVVVAHPIGVTSGFIVKINCG